MNSYCWCVSYRVHNNKVTPKHDQINIATCIWNLPFIFNSSTVYRRFWSLLATFGIKTPLTVLQKISVSHTYFIWKCSILTQVNTYHIRYNMYDWRKSFANNSDEFWFRRSRSSEIDGYLPNKLFLCKAGSCPINRFSRDWKNSEMPDTPFFTKLCKL